MAGQKESALKKKVIQWLIDHRVIHWIIPVAGMAFANTVVRNPLVGFPDILTVWEGRFITLELKRPVGGVQRDGQKLQEKKIRAGGGEYHLVREVEMLEQIYCERL